MKIWTWTRTAYQNWGRDLGWGLLLYLLVLVSLFFVFARGSASFVYAAF